MVRYRHHTHTSNRRCCFHTKTFLIVETVSLSRSTVVQYQDSLLYWDPLSRDASVTRDCHTLDRWVTLLLFVLKVFVTNQRFLSKPPLRKLTTLQFSTGSVVVTALAVRILSLVLTPLTQLHRRCTACSTPEKAAAARPHRSWFPFRKLPDIPLLAGCIAGCSSFPCLPQWFTALVCYSIWLSLLVLLFRLLFFALRLFDSVTRSADLLLILIALLVLGLCVLLSGLAQFRRFQPCPVRFHGFP